MKKVSLLLLIVVPFFVYSQDTIHWTPCYQLKYEDFQGKPDTAKIDLANSYIQIDYSYKIINGQLQYKVNCYFFKKLSWSKFNMATLTEHEQIHFNIAELFALKLEQKFEVYEITTNVDYDLRAIYDKIVEERLQTDNLFDAKIKNATNDIPQKIFMADIAKQIPSCEIKKVRHK